MDYAEACWTTLTLWVREEGSLVHLRKLRNELELKGNGKVCKSLRRCVTGLLGLALKFRLKWRANDEPRLDETLSEPVEGVGEGGTSSSLGLADALAEEDEDQRRLDLNGLKDTGGGPKPGKPFGLVSRLSG